MTKPNERLRLWPATAPGSAAVQMALSIDERSPDTSQFLDRAVSRIADPYMEVFHPQRPNGTTVLVAPGGGYQRVVWDKEGVEVAHWLNALGITVALLVYRLPAEGHAEGQWVPLQDAQRAMRILRHKAQDWGLQPGRVGAMGFSAGGHVVATLANCFDKACYAPMDEADECSARPDFVMLGYPVISMDSQIAHAGSRERLLGADAGRLDEAFSADRMVRPDTPETFILLPDDDAAVPPENSIRYYLALRRAGVKAELHVFRDGGHGFGIRLAQGPVRAWTQLCEAWLRQCGWLERVA